MSKLKQPQPETHWFRCECRICGQEVVLELSADDSKPECGGWECGDTFELERVDNCTTH